MSARPEFLDCPPVETRLTDYDRAHLATYVRLLDAESEGAAWQEVAKIIFGIDANCEFARAEHIYQTHLARAHWMTNNGFRELIRSRFH